jgi:hypothetical protein
MTYVPPATYEIPSAGQHVAVLIDESDLGLEPNSFDPSKPARRMGRVVFAVDELGTDGQPLQVRDKVTLTRHPKGDLIKYVRAFCHPNQITTNSWELSNYIGTCVGLNIVHAVKPTGTYANIDSVFPLPQTAKRISIPAGYVRKGSTATTAASYNVTSNTTAPVDQPKPPQTGRQAAGQQEEEVQAQLPLA